MSDFAIRVAGLGKHYQLGARENAYTTLRETLAGFITNPLKRFKSLWDVRPRTNRSGPFATSRSS